MPLSKARMRERKRWDRAGVKPMSNLNGGVAVKPTIVGLKMEGNRITGSVKPNVQPNAPLYNPIIHRAGDRVLIKPPHSKQLIETVIPTIDADGNVIPEFT